MTNQLGKLDELVTDAHAHRPAIVAPGCSWSYDDVRRQCADIANALVAAGVQAGDVVALLVDGSAEDIVRMLGITRARAAFAPVACDWPSDYVRAILARSRIGLAIGRHTDVAALGKEWSFMAALPHSAIAAGVFEHPIVRQRLNGVSYVIHTSGSSGLPKAVAIPDTAIRAYSAAIVSRLCGVASPRSAVLTTLAADLAMTGIWPVLMCGGSVHLVPRQVASDPQSLARHLRTEGIDFLKIVPTYLRWLASHLPAGALDTIKWIVSGGEPLDSALCRLVGALAPNARLMNHYGPTETTVGVAAGPVSSVTAISEVVAVGPPLDGAAIYVLDDQLSPTAVGERGEVYVGGRQVAIGYLCAPSATAEVFIPDPFSAAPGARMYRTGDIGSWNGRDELVCHGRVDDHVKIRGVRVSPQEIAGQLSDHPAVHDAIVLAHTNPRGETSLAAFVVPSATTTITETQLLEWLSHRLPQEKCPARLHLLSRFPLTSNGKLDRHALAQAALAAAQPARPSTPRNGQEWVMTVWAELLGKPVLSPDANFFDIGGHSLLLIEFHAKLVEEWGDVLGIADLFRFTTARMLGVALAGAKGRTLGQEAVDGGTIGSR